MELEKKREMNTGRTVLITGVGKGLGKALALELATRGHTIIGCSRSQPNIDSLQLQLASFPNRNHNHLFFNADIVSASSITTILSFCFSLSTHKQNLILIYFRGVTKAFSKWRNL